MSFIIGGITYFLGLVMILTILIMAAMEMGGIIALAVFSGIGAGIYYGIKWSKEG